MRKLGGIAVLVAVLAVSGCAAGAESTQSAATAETGAQASEVAPTPTGTPGQDLSDQYEPDDLLLLIVDKQWQGSSRPDDTTIIAAGHAACEQLEGGANIVDVVVLPDVSEADNTTVVTAAISAYCRGV